mmetsp:Transcript_24584/g.44196  ORF Transcript_24584/g.44196 Transcript_24584/m.44196 type:complete len:81 (-) Transcript_24584:1179-1421(-)
MVSLNDNKDGGVEVVEDKQVVALGESELEGEEQLCIDVLNDGSQHVFLDSQSLKLDLDLFTRSFLVCSKQNESGEGIWRK